MAININADNDDVALLGAIQDGLPLCEKPFAQIGEQLNMSETEVIARLKKLINTGIIRRFGLVMQHHNLGFRANAMVVFNIPDDDVDNIAAQIIKHDFVTLCYCRHRNSVWPYNLYCMIHGRERTLVEAQIETLKNKVKLTAYASKTLFSKRRFKQTGARFSAAKINISETV